MDEVLTEGRRRATGKAHHPYDRSKALAEDAVLDVVEQGLSAVIVQPTGIIGPHDYKPSRMGRFILALAQGKLPGLMTGGFNWVDVRDVCDTAIKAEKSNASGESYLLGGHWASFIELAEWVHRAGGNRPPRLVAPRWLARFGAVFADAAQPFVREEPLFGSGALHMVPPRHINISSAKAKAELDHCPRPLAETITDTLDWWHHRGQITP